MIFLYIANEFSVDKFHAKGKNIYRVMRQFDPTKPSVPYLSGPYAPALANDFPDDIKAAVRVKPQNYLATYGEKAFNEKKVYSVDSGFFELFSYPLIKGNAATVLKDAKSIVLTENSAKKYFGSIDSAMGKVITFDKETQFKVTGIAKNLPSNTHLDFDMVIPISNLVNYDWFKGWMNNSMFVYVELNEHTNKARLEQQFPNFMDKYLGKEMARFGAKMGLSLTPLTDIYFEPSSGCGTAKRRWYMFLFPSPY
jgi:putative ABC transport system permease protein